MSKRKADQAITEPDVVKALAHPLRVRILDVLGQRTVSPKGLADELGASLGTVSYHVRALAALGMVQLVARKQRRGATEHFYRATARQVITDTGWAKLPEIVKARMIDANLATTGAYVQAAAEQGGFSRPEIHASRTTVECDEQAWTDLSRTLSDAFERVRQIADESAARVAREPHPARFDATAVLMLFEGGAPTSTASQPQATTRRATGHRGD